MKLSYLSGADTDLDGRVAARADLDHDGDEDLIVVSRNRPILTVYENTLKTADFIVVKIAPQPIGATVRAKCGDRTIRRDVFGGEGFGTNSSRTLTIGLGDCPVVDRLSVRYPGGVEEAYDGLASHRAYVLQPGAKPKVIEDYLQNVVVSDDTAELATITTDWLPTADYVYVTLWASWCTACKAAQPKLEALHRDVRVVAVSVEPEDDEIAVEGYAKTFRPPFDLAPYESKRIAALETVLGEHPPLPSGMLVERATGRVLWSGTGVATRSDVARAVELPEPGGLDLGRRPIIIAGVVLLLALGLWARSRREA